MESLSRVPALIAAFCLVDPADPIAAAYAKAFPDLFTDEDEVPDELRAHFRFPEDLFRDQTDTWGRYHIGDPDEFYSQSDHWNIAIGDPSRAGSVVDPRGAAEPAVDVDDDVGTRFREPHARRTLRAEAMIRVVAVS